MRNTSRVSFAAGLAVAVTLALAAPALALDGYNPGAPPQGTPGLDAGSRLASAAGAYALWACVLGVIGGAAVWAIGQRSGMGGLQAGGAATVGVAIVAAIIIANAADFVEFGVGGAGSSPAAPAVQGPPAGQPAPAGTP